MTLNRSCSAWLGVIGLSSQMLKVLRQHLGKCISALRASNLSVEPSLCPTDEMLRHYMDESYLIFSVTTGS
jgi:hypothetical protein